MAGPPLKPWERGEIHNQLTTSLNEGLQPSFDNHMASGSVRAASGATFPLTTSTSAFSVTGVPVPSSVAPPLPLRTPPTARAPLYNGGGLSGIGSGYGGIGGGYGGYSPYGGGYGAGYIGGLGGEFGGGFGGYGGGYGMNRIGTLGAGDYARVGDGGFAEQAELNSRSAFQSVESVVQTVGSVAFMLDATYQAVYHSFRSVLAVTDHFSRMRAQLSGAIWRTLHWLAQRLRALLNLGGAGIMDKKVGRVEEGAEETKEAGVGGGELEAQQGEKVGARGWPVALFFALVLGGPWLLWKLLSYIAGGDGASWMSGAADHFVAVSEFDFERENADELSFKRGTRIIVAPKELQPHVRGWLLGSVDGRHQGLLPANRVRILGKQRGSKSGGADAAFFIPAPNSFAPQSSTGWGTSGSGVPRASTAVPGHATTTLPHQSPTLLTSETTTMSQGPLPSHTGAPMDRVTPHAVTSDVTESTNLVAAFSLEASPSMPPESVALRPAEDKLADLKPKEVSVSGSDRPEFVSKNSDLGILINEFSQDVSN